MAAPPMATGTIGNAEGTVGVGAWLGIADGDTETGLPQDAPGASGGVGTTSDSVMGGVVGQSGE